MHSILSPSLGYALDMFVNFGAFQPGHSLTKHSYKKEEKSSVLMCCNFLWLTLGVPAAKLSTQQVEYPVNTQLRIAFDLDAVLFSDESEKIFKSKGLDAFLNHEIEKRNVPLKEVKVFNSSRYCTHCQS